VSSCRTSASRPDRSWPDSSKTVLCCLFCDREQTTAAAAVPAASSMLSSVDHSCPPAGTPCASTPDFNTACGVQQRNPKSSCASISNRPHLIKSVSGSRPAVVLCCAVLAALLLLLWVIVNVQHCLDCPQLLLTHNLAALQASTAAGSSQHTVQLLEACAAWG
jgi:hypothetical protein